MSLSYSLHISSKKNAINYQYAIEYMKECKIFDTVKEKLNTVMEVFKKFNHPHNRKDGFKELNKIFNIENPRDKGFDR